MYGPSDRPPHDQGDEGSSEERPAADSPQSSFKAWWDEQKAAGQRDWQRLRTWWREHTTPLEEPPRPTPRATPVPSKSGRFGNTARIAAWAPTAVVLALLGAAFTAAIAFGVLSQFKDYSVMADRLMIGIAVAVIFGLLMFWFSAAPNVRTTTKRFWLLFQVEVVLLGMVALAIAIRVTLEHLGILSI